MVRRGRRRNDRRVRFDIVSVNVALPSVLLEWSGGEVMSAIDKEPVAADEVLLTELNLDGDRQADTRPTPGGGQVHGGLDQAVYAFPSEHYPRLEQIVGRPLSWGFMGENLTVRGATEGDVWIGDEWSWGSARLQVSAPRGPCYKLGIRIGKQAMRTVIREEVLVGWYLRVLTPGRVPTTGHITVERADPSKVSVRQVQQALNDRSNTYPDLAIDPLADKWKRALNTAGRDLSGGVPESDG
jgi:MOSC domain-containing protein YiiM